MPNMPSQPITKRTLQGEYSNIRFEDGMVETILFGADGNAIATRRTYVGIATIQREHIESIEAELGRDGHA